MQLAYPIGLALSKPLLQRLDAIARSEGVSRSSLARTLLLKAVVEHERGSGCETDEIAAEALRPWRPRNPRQREDTSAQPEDGAQS